MSVFGEGPMILQGTASLFTNSTPQIHNILVGYTAILTNAKMNRLIKVDTVT